jgi:hypothetical protein
MDAEAGQYRCKVVLMAHVLAIHKSECHYARCVCLSFPSLSLGPYGVCIICAFGSIWRFDNCEGFPPQLLAFCVGFGAQFLPYGPEIRGIKEKNVSFIGITIWLFNQRTSMKQTDSD